MKAPKKGLIFCLLVGLRLFTLSTDWRFEGMDRVLCLGEFFLIHINFEICSLRWKKYQTHILKVKGSKTEPTFHTGQTQIFCFCCCLLVCLFYLGYENLEVSEGKEGGGFGWRMDNFPVMTLIDFKFQIQLERIENGRMSVSGGAQNDDENISIIQFNSRQSFRLV